MTLKIKFYDRSDVYVVDTRLNTDTSIKILFPNMRITLVGDSVLDNFYWLFDRTHDLKYELNQLGYEVDNFAVDESKVGDIIYGIEPRDVYQQTRHYPYPCDKEGKVNPLKLLSSNGSDLCVISVGGNDMRVNMWKIALGIDNFINSVLDQSFIDNLDHVLTNVKMRSKRTVLVCVYVPYLGRGSRYESFSGYRSKVFDKLLSVYKTIAQKHDIPLLDLSRTFDYNNRIHYGSTEIEPSNLSNKCIADCIDYICNNYNGYAVYYAPDCDSSDIRVESGASDINNETTSTNYSKCIIQ